MRAIEASELGRHRFDGGDTPIPVNAQDGIAAIDSGIHFDLVFSDINLPGSLDG
jgi:hypothetical protein